MKCHLPQSYFFSHLQTAKWIKSAAVLKHALGPGFTSVVPNGFVFFYWWMTARVCACTHMRIDLCVCVFCLFLFSIHCVNTIPAFMRLPEPICVPAGAILARRRPPLGTIWALLKVVSTPPPLSSPHCDQSCLLWREEEIKLCVYVRACVWF